MMVQVWHERVPTFGINSPSFPDGFVHVATVEVDARDGDTPQSIADWAFEATNTVSRPWWLAPAVVSHVGPARSTSVGDVVVVAGIPWRCEPVGWRAVQP